MATKRQGVPCYDKAFPDEPIFVLRAQDSTAPDAVRAWARNAQDVGAPMKKVQDALACAEAMEAWQAQNHAKTPD